MLDCDSCFFQNFSEHVCKLHKKRHEIVEREKELTRRQKGMIAQQKKLVAIERQLNRRKTRSKVFFGSAMGFTGGVMGIKALGIVAGVALHIVAAPVVLGAAVMGGGWGAIKGLRRKKKVKIKQNFTMSEIYGFKSKKH